MLIDQVDEGFLPAGKTYADVLRRGSGQHGRAVVAQGRIEDANVMAGRERVGGFREREDGRAFIEQQHRHRCFVINLVAADGLHGEEGGTGGELVGCDPAGGLKGAAQCVGAGDKRQVRYVGRLVAALGHGAKRQVMNELLEFVLLGL